MKTSMHSFGSRCGLAGVAAAVLISATTASAALREYHAVWSGALHGNSASATGVITIDDSLLENPGDSSTSFSVGNRAVVDVVITVSGASSGNGTFTTSDFDFYYLNIVDALDLDAEWVGQAQPSSGNTWGDPSSTSHDFNLFGNAPGTPFGVYWYDLAAGGPGGDAMRLISFGPANEEISLTVGTPVANVSNTVVSAVYPPQVAPDGELYLRGKIKGSGVGSTNDTCLLVWDGTEASTIVRENDALAGNSITAFGDPLLKGTRLYFAARLLKAGAVTGANDDVVAGVNTDGTSLAQLAREGDSAPGASGYSFVKFLWMHPASNGLFIGATVANESGVKKTGVWHSNNSSLSLLAITDGPVTINGTETAIKSITKPAAGAPANISTRVGDDTSVVLMIKGTNGVVALKRFNP